MSTRLLEPEGVLPAGGLNRCENGPIDSIRALVRPPIELSGDGLEIRAPDRSPIPTRLLEPEGVLPAGGLNRCENGPIDSLRALVRPPIEPSRDGTEIRGPDRPPMSTRPLEPKGALPAGELNRGVGAPIDSPRAPERLSNEPSRGGLEGCGPDRSPPLKRPLDRLAPPVALRGESDGGWNDRGAEPEGELGALLAVESRPERRGSRPCAVG